MHEHGNISRRDLIKTVAAGAAMTAIGRLMPRASWAAEPGAKRPNIVIIMADDMGYSDIGCYGGEIQTPNIDALAQRGVKFTSMYNMSRCCPTRACLLTGLYPHQAGVGHMTEETDLPAYLGHLNDQCVTMAEALRLAEYNTIMSGKWHVGDDRPYWPCDRGFDESFALRIGWSDYFKPTNMALNDAVYEAPKDAGYYLTDDFTDHAVKSLDKYGKESKPFFLYLAYTSPHWPLHAPAEEIKKYKELYSAGWEKLRAARYERMVKMGIIDEKWKLTERDASHWETVENKENMATRMAAYAAQIDKMDQGIGKVLAKIKELGAEENTLVLFLSDNGGTAQVHDLTAGPQPGTPESHLSYGQAWANMSNTPFVKYKKWVHEGGISTPLIVSWPAMIAKGGGLIRDVAHVIDLMPTVLEAAGAEYPKTHKGKAILPIEGSSILPLTKGKARNAPEAYYWEHGGRMAVRQGKWKLVRAEPNPWELYDMEADRTETTNLAEGNVDKVKQLGEMYDRWAARCQVEPFAKVQKAAGVKAASKPAGKKTDD